MSEQNFDGESSVNNFMSNQQEETMKDLHSTNLIEYSDSVDERMMDMVKNGKDPREARSSGWIRRGDFHYDEVDSDSDEEYVLSNLSQKCSGSKAKEDIESGVESDSSLFDRKYANEIMYQQHVDLNEEEMPVNESTLPNNVQELIRKFSTIELLREKENLKKTQENEMSKPCCAAGKALQASEENPQAMNPEEFLGWKKNRDLWKGKASASEDLEATVPDEDDKEIDEIVQLLSSSSLIKDYDENLAFPKEEDEILKTFLQSEEKMENSLDHRKKKYRSKVADSMLDVCESAPGTESQETSKSQSLGDIISDWKEDTSEDLCSIFDGYDIDNLCSFHDWMLDDFLSRSRNTLHEPEFTL